MEYKDYYSILGVERKATPDDIKKAYRRLARKYHPDVSKEKNAEEQFKNLQEAYEVLKDPEKRNAYDQLGSQWKSGQEFRPPPGWQSQGRYRHEQFTEEDLGSFSDFFANLFGGGGGQEFGRGHRGYRRQQRGGDQHAKVAIPLEEAFRGTSRTFQLQMPDASVRTIKVNIPPGTMPGQQLRLAGQGSPGMEGGPAGDLYLEVEILPHRFFSLSGRDVILNLPVTPWEAAIGADIRVPTLGGLIGLKLAPGSQTGQKLRLKGRGMPAKAAAGDQYAIIQIMTPPIQNNEDKALYEKMAQLMPFNPRKDWGV